MIKVSSYFEDCGMMVEAQLVPRGISDMTTLKNLTKTDDGQMEIKEGLLCRFVPLIGKYAFPEDD